MGREAVLTVIVWSYTIATMFGLGCSINVSLIEEIKKSPKAVLCGVASQYLFMPLIGFGLCILFDLGPSETIGILLCCMSPGGVTSGLFVLWTNGNVLVSLVMTTCSTIIAFAAIPLLIFIYLRPPVVSAGDNVKVSYSAIIISLLIATLPSLIGWRLRQKFDEVGAWLERMSTRLGAILIVAAIIFIYSWPSKNASGVTAKALIAIILMGPFGFTFGYVAARLIARLDIILSRTISFETGIQQIGIAGSIAILSFDGDRLDKIISVITTFGVATFLTGCIFSVGFRAFDGTVNSQTALPVVKEDEIISKEYDEDEKEDHSLQFSSGHDNL